MSRARQRKRPGTERFAVPFTLFTPFATWLVKTSSDLLALAMLAGTLSLVLGATGLAPQARTGYTIEAAASQLILRNFYGLEQNASGSYRWTAPDATIGIPVPGPGVYRMLLRLQDSPAASARRDVAIAIRDLPIGTVALEPAPRDYAFEFSLSAQAWAREAGGTIPISLRTTPFKPPGDGRNLGVIVQQIQVEPLAAASPADWLPIIGLNLVLLLLAYGTLRTLGNSLLLSTTIAAAAIAAYTILALASRSDALYLACLIARPQPVTIVALVALLTACLLPRGASRPFPEIEVRPSRGAHR